MADPFTLAVLSAGKAVAGAAAASGQAKDEARRLDAEARLADTQALQRDTQLRDELDRFMSATVSARAANGLSAYSPNALRLMQEANKVSSEERTRMTANDRQRAANMRAGASAARRSARMSLLTGAVKAAVPLAEYGAYQAS
jgi:hypothetical protein